MPQTAVLESGLDHRTRVDHQPQDVSNHAVAKTAELVARASLGDQVAWDQLVERCGGVPSPPSMTWSDPRPGIGRRVPV